jgi:hypothetical protein
MRRISCNFILAVGLILTLGWVNEAFAGNADAKRPRNAGVLSVQVTFEELAKPASYRVLVDGKEIGMSGNRTPSIFYLAPGVYTVEIIGVDDKVYYEKEIEIRKKEKNCICLRIVEREERKPCPYDVRVEVTKQAAAEGETVIFRAVNAISASVPLTYRWSVTPASARIVGEREGEIEVDTTGLGGQPITAYLDVTDDVYGKTCFQKNSTSFTPPPPVITQRPEPVLCVVFESTSFDDDKYRFDQCAIQLRNRPDAKLYINVYQGTDKLSRTRITADLVRRRTLDYLVKARGIDPKKIDIFMRGTRPRTTIEIWIVPAGADAPVVRD